MALNKLGEIYLRWNYSNMQTMLELTTSIVPWRNPDTRTIPMQTENVAVPFDLRAWLDCTLVTV